MSLPMVPSFEPLKTECKYSDGTAQSFNPVSHDILYLHEDGDLRIARNASPEMMINVLKASNERHLKHCEGQPEDFASSLIVVRFEEEESIGSTAPTESNWRPLWPYFDSCCNSDTDAFNFVSSIRQSEPHLNSSISPACSSAGPSCGKISYNLNFGDKHILITHHFHKLDGKCKEMVRMMTYGLPEQKVAFVLNKAISYIQADTCSGHKQIPHPKVILCSMLECVEAWCRITLQRDRKYIIGRLETQIRKHRNPDVGKPQCLEINYVELSDARIGLGEVRRKLEHTKLAVATLEKQKGLLDEMMAEEGERWDRQLKEVCPRLAALKLRCQEHDINLQNLQERVSGILETVKILLAEKENKYSHQSDKRRHKRAEFQIEMLKHQEEIAFRAKRDNTVLKVIAVLTALFLPGAFIAQIFAVPIFNWDQDQIIGRHFMIYWYFTIPITTVLVVGFSVWFGKMYLDDKQKDAAKAKSKKDPEQSVDSRSEESSLNSRRI